MMSLTESLWQPSGLATRPAVVILAAVCVSVSTSLVCFGRSSRQKTAINLVIVLSWF